MKYNIKLINKISQEGLAHANPDLYNFAEDVQHPDALMVRSGDLHNYDFCDSIGCVVRAGAGVNNIPVDRCSEQGIVVFNTPGANANAVKELAMCAMLMASRDIVGGINWAASLTENVAAAVEKGKGAFTGPELYKKTLGVVGLGAIGALVSNIGISLGMDVIGYDPFMSIESAWRIDRHITRAKDLSTIYENSDYISLHLPVNSDTRDTINADSIALMKDGVRIINLARGELVCDDDMLAAIESGKVAAYVTDFPNEKLLGKKGVVCIPHLGASTPESEENCAVMATQQLAEYLESGNIRNSVNFPNAEAPLNGAQRVCVAHRNIPNIIASISSVFSAQNINISNFLNKSRKELAYTILDLDSESNPAMIDAIRGVEGVLKVRVI